MILKLFLLLCSTDLTNTVISDYTIVLLFAECTKSYSTRHKRTVHDLINFIVVLYIAG